MRSIRIHLLILAFTALAVCGLSCATKTDDRPSKTTGRVYHVMIQADSNSNMGSPVDVDIVSAYDAQLVREIESTTASGWFAYRKKYVDKHAGKIFVMSREIAPGNRVQLEYTTEREAKPVATFVFARYNSPGDHRIKVEKFEPIVIHLDEEGFAVPGD